MSVNPDDTVQEYKEKQAHQYDGSASPESGSLADPRSASDEELLREALYPSDSYAADGTYWADLPRGERMSFATTQFNTEARRDMSYVWNMFKNDPAEPFRAYWRKYVLTGMGLFVEGAFLLSSRRRGRPADDDRNVAGYVLFSIGNLSALFKAAWPACWSKHTVCSKSAFHLPLHNEFRPNVFLLNS